MDDNRGSARADQELSLHDDTSVGLRLHDTAQAGADGAEILAVAGDGAHIGRTTYARLYGPRAELTLDVDDGFWHRGVPGALLDELVAHAASRGISTLIAPRLEDMRRGGAP